MPTARFHYLSIATISPLALRILKNFSLNSMDQLEKKEKENKNPTLEHPLRYLTFRRHLLSWSIYQHSTSLHKTVFLFRVGLIDYSLFHCWAGSEEEINLTSLSSIYLPLINALTSSCCPLSYCFYIPSIVEASNKGKEDSSDRTQKAHSKHTQPLRSVSLTSSFCGT